MLHAYALRRLREEVTEQIRALNELKEMAASYGDDVSKPATTAREAVQWVSLLPTWALLPTLGHVTARGAKRSDAGGQRRPVTASLQPYP